MYTAAGSLDKEYVVEEYAPLVRRMAHHLAAKLPASVQIDDIIQAGLIGLTQSIRRTIGWAIRALCETAAGMLPSSADGAASRGCGTISIPRSRIRTENAPQCELCGTP